LTPLALLLGRGLNQATLRWQWPNLVFAADSPYGRVTVEALDSQRVFYADGLLAFESQGTAAEEVAHFPLLAHPDPQRALLVGGGVAGDLREILKHPVDAVTYVELDPLLIEAAQAYLPPADAIVLRDSRVRVVTTDGRLYVKTTGERFDVVILDLPEPITAALNRFYTAEFFGEARSILRPGGILALHLPSAENYWSPELARRNASIFRTLNAVFAQILVLPGERNFLLASDAALETDPRTLAARLAGRGVQTRWVTPEYLGYVLTGDRFEQVKRGLETAGDVRLNRDLYPISYYYGQALWASMLNPGLRGALERAGVVSLWWLAVPFLLAAGLTRWRRSWAVPFAVACAGFGGMLCEVVILFAFQVVHGSLYAEVGLIVAGYMGGLALGGAAANGGWRMANRKTQNAKRKTQMANRKSQIADHRWQTTEDECRMAPATTGENEAEHPERSGGAFPATQSKDTERSLAWAHPSTTSGTPRQTPLRMLRFLKTALLVVLGLTVAFAGAMALLLTHVRSLPAPAFWLMALIAGGLGGMVYPLAVRLWRADAQAQVEQGEETLPGRARSGDRPERYSDRFLGGETRRSAAAGALYGADLLGGCLAALVGATFLVPVLGIPQACALVAIAGLAGLVAMV
jgi:spermidine synthase